MVVYRLYSTLAIHTLSAESDKSPHLASTSGSCYNVIKTLVLPQPFGLVLYAIRGVDTAFSLVARQLTLGKTFPLIIKRVDAL